MVSNMDTEIRELIKSDNTSKETRLLCTFILDIHKEILFLKKLVWATFTTNISLLIGIATYVLLNR